jgi:hypothetical protein
MRYQRGLSLSGLLVGSVIVVVAALLLLKLLPHYMEYWKVQKAFKEIAMSPESRGVSPREIQTAFARRLVVEDFKAVKPEDLEVSKDGDSIVVSASWSVKVPLFANISAWIDFEARSNK